MACCFFSRNKHMQRRARSSFCFSADHTGRTLETTQQFLEKYGQYTHYIYILCTCGAALPYALLLASIRIPSRMIPIHGCHPFRGSFHFAFHAPPSHTVHPLCHPFPIVSSLRTSTYVQRPKIIAIRQLDESFWPAQDRSPYHRCRARSKKRRKNKITVLGWPTLYQSLSSSVWDTGYSSSLESISTPMTGLASREEKTRHTHHPEYVHQ
ncbi:hypothetical protein CPB86DRAFT_238787 [Serendipita vermifera]|nr:hypothetical protein CPB86DRAFT_238787 [Serendipita vermifera]